MVEWVKAQTAAGIKTMRVCTDLAPFVYGLGFLCHRQSYRYS